MAACVDDAATVATTPLSFIADAALRESIRLDMSGAHRDLGQDEWKGATVLAGSAIEALLLWALQERERNKPGDVPAAVAALIGSKTLKGNPGAECLNEVNSTYVPNLFGGGKAIKQTQSTNISSVGAISVATATSVPDLPLSEMERKSRLRRSCARSFGR